MLYPLQAFQLKSLICLKQHETEETKTEKNTKQKIEERCYHKPTSRLLSLLLTCIAFLFPLDS
jgi:hypothetical protein